MTAPSQGVPGPPLVNPDGGVTGPWWSFFVTLYTRSGGATGSIAVQLDTISNVAGSTLYRGASQWVGLNPGSQYQVLAMGTQYPGWSFLSGSNFGSQTKNNFLAAPPGANGGATFRTIQTVDLVPIEGQFPGTATNDSANTGNVGEYFFSNISTPVALSNGSSANVTSLNLSAGDWDVWGNLVTNPAGSTTQSNIKAWISLVSASDPGPPNNGAYAQLQTSIAAGLLQCLAVSPIRLSLPSAATVYLSANVSFAVSTLGAYGFLGARRRR